MTATGSASPFRAKVFVAIVLIALPALVMPNSLGRTLAGIGLFLSLVLVVSAVDGSAKGDSRRETLLGVGLGVVYGSLFANTFFRTASFGFAFYLGALLLAVALVSGWRETRQAAKEKVPDRPPLDDVI